jgi:hypothetical protein
MSGESSTKPETRVTRGLLDFTRTRLDNRHRAFLHRENPTFKIWQRMRFVAVLMAKHGRVGRMRCQIYESHYQKSGNASAFFILYSILPRIC